MEQNLWSLLYNIVCIEANDMKGLIGTSMEGHEFEDKVTNVISHSSIGSSMSCFPPRSMLTLPTFSGIQHQIDCLFVQDRIHFAIECKRRMVSTKEQIYFFNSIITDYVLGIKLQRIKDKIRGIYMSTAPIENRSLSYCLAYGIRVIHPSLPPIEYMLQTTEDSSLKKGLRILLSRITEFNPLYDEIISKPDSVSSILVFEYKDLVEKWRNRRINVENS